MDTYNVIGVMSGTSLDGVDIAFCTFKLDNAGWSYVINKAKTFPYSDEWKGRLSLLETKPGLELAQTNVDYGVFLGKLIKDFLSENKIKAEFISSHGHTIFHQPENKLTVQIGSGASIAAEVNLPVICDFRTLDVALGGQGAPLVPIGDNLLFPDYKYCLNLGGFANVSYNKNETIAYDICPVNIVLNFLANLEGKDFDLDGELGRAGSIDSSLLDKLNSLEFYKKNPPKSLGKEWITEKILPILSNSPLSVKDKVRTMYEHIALQIKNCFTDKTQGNILITGGGAHNSFLIKIIKDKLKIPVFIPDKQTIDFKEALIFAFLGVLRFRNEINTLSSVTGAIKDSCGGSIYYNQ